MPLTPAPVTHDQGRIGAGRTTVVLLVASIVLLGYGLVSRDGLTGAAVAMGALCLGTAVGRVFGPRRRPPG